MVGHININTENISDQNITKETTSDEVLIGENDDDAAFLAHALQKQKARERRNEDKKHSEPEEQYRKQRKKRDQVLGHIGTSLLDIQDKTTNQQAIQQELDDNSPEGAPTISLEVEDVLDKYSRLFDFLGEDKKININVDSQYAAIKDKKERLKFVSSLSLANKLQLFHGDNFSISSYEGLIEAMSFQQDRIDDDEYKYLGGTNRVATDIGLLRASLRAAMVDTPEFAAYKLAKEYHYRDNDTGFYNIPADFPAIRGYESEIREEGDIGDWNELIDEYELIEKEVSKSHPNYSEKELEHESIKSAASLFALSMVYNRPDVGPNSSYLSSFHESVAWAKLHWHVRDRLRGMRQKVEHIDLHNIERFIGKSGYSEKSDSMEHELERLSNRLNIFESLPNDDKRGFLEKENAIEIKKKTDWKEREIARIKHKYDKLIKKTRSEERIAEYTQQMENKIQEVSSYVANGVEYFQNRGEDEFITDINNRKDFLRKKINKRKSLPEKAIDLYWSGYDSKYVHSIDWINTAPFSTIKKAHKMLSDGINIDTIYRRLIIDASKKALGDNSEDDSELEHILDVAFEQRPEGQGCNIFKEIDSLADAYPDIDIKKISTADFVTLLCPFEQGHYYDMSGFIKDYSLEVYISALRAGMSQALLNNLREAKITNIKPIIDYPWLASCIELEGKRANEFIDSFPCNGNDSARYNWCSKNAFAHLDGDWGRQTIGKIIYTRLQAGVDKSIHDASYWLSDFQMPECAYDIQRIKHDVSSGEDISSLDNYKMRLYNIGNEQYFIHKIITASDEERARLKLSSKEQNISRLFSTPENSLIYKELVKIYKNPDFTYDALVHAVKESMHDYYIHNIDGGPNKDSMWRMTEQVFQENINSTLDDVIRHEIWRNYDYRIGETMQRLNRYGLNRKAYIDDTTSWLVKHTVSPSKMLTSAWGDRALALSYGSNDTASEIIHWKKKGALMAFVDSRPGFVKSQNLTKEEIFGAFGPFADELINCDSYGSETIIEAIANYKSLANPNKIMPAENLKVGNNKHTGTVIAYDSPKGMTIGPDTGCCMTLNGESRDCIKSGYRDSGAGFFALYDQRNHIMAQSYFYINPEHPEIAVMDNIEANDGRDSYHIVDLYQEFFTKYLTNRFTTDPNWKVRQINVGTRYGQVAKAQVLKLKSTEIIRNAYDCNYSDAEEDQRLLVRLTDEQISKARKSGNITPPQLDPVQNRTANEFVSPLGLNQLPVMQALEARIYEEETDMRQYYDTSFAENELNSPGASKYSFIMHSKKDASDEAIGYCLAYEAESEINPSSDEKVVYVADFGVIPEERGSNAALRGFNELLSRVKSSNVKVIEMDARESTSYKIFASDSGKRFLARKGFIVKEYPNRVTNFNNNERTFLLRLEAH